MRARRASAGQRALRAAGRQPGRRRPARRDTVRLPLSACCSGDVGGDDVGRAAVQGGPGPVVAHRGPRVGVGCSFLDIPQRDPSVKTGMNACLSVCGPTGLVIPVRRTTRRTIRAAPCRSRRRPSAARKTGPSHRSPTARSIARAVRGASGMVTTLPPLRVMVSVRCPRSRPSASILAPVASETRRPLSASREMSACSAAVPRPAATSRAPELVAVQPSGMGLIVQPGTSDMGCRGVVEEVFLDGVLAEPGDGAQPAGHRRPSAAPGFQVAGEALDVGTPGLEQADVALLAPRGELAQVQGVSLTGQAGVTGQEPSQGESLRTGEHRLGHGDHGGRGQCRGGHRAPPGSG